MALPYNRLAASRRSTANPFGADLQTSDSDFADVGEGCFAVLSLAGTAGDGRPLGYPNAVHIPIYHEIDVLDFRAAVV